MPYTPQFKGNATIRYTFRFMDWNAFAQGAFVYQTKNYATLRPGDTAYIGTMPAYGTADFSLGASKDRLSMEVFIKNAFDERGQVNRYTPCTTSVCGSGYTNVSPSVPPAVYVVPIQPMTIGVRFGQKF